MYTYSQVKTPQIALSITWPTSNVGEHAQSSDASRLFSSVSFVVCFYVYFYFGFVFNLVFC